MSEPVFRRDRFCAMHPFDSHLYCGYSIGYGGLKNRNDCRRTSGHSNIRTQVGAVGSRAIYLASSPGKRQSYNRPLHEVIQAAMGWTNSHLHEFVVGAHSYSDPEFEIDEAKSEFRYRLARLAPRERNTIAYHYDFGDGWEHQIRVESIIEDDKRYPGTPVCLAGARHCPPEDCGGPGGYHNFLKAISNKNHKEHRELLDWVGGSFDPEYFDVGEVNKKLRKIDLRPRW